MADDVKIGYSMYLTERVEELLREGTLNEILEFIKQDLQREWLQTAPSDSETRELIYQEIHALNRIDLKVQSIVDHLRFAKKRGES